jgi:osmotically-inducible protein OsmY
MDCRRLVVAVAVSLATAGLVACGGGKPDVKENVENAFEREKVENVNVDWDDEARVLHLKGAVATDAEKARAESVATQAVGTSGKVANELTLRVDRTSADNLDGTINDHVENLIDEDPVWTKSEIEVSVNNGVVTLKGDIVSDADRKRLVDQVGRVPGVQNVVDSLQIAAAK